MSVLANQLPWNGGARVLLEWKPTPSSTTTPAPLTPNDQPESNGCSLKTRLDELTRLIKTERKKFDLLAQRKSRIQLRLWKLHQEYRQLDYALAKTDGRLTIVPPAKTPTIRCRLSSAPKKSNLETVREALAKMSAANRTELLNSLLE